MLNYSKEAELWRKKKQEVIEKINNADVPLILFGKAPVIDKLFFDHFHVPIEYICDNDPEKQGTVLWGLPIISPNEIGKHYEKYNVLILVPFEHEIVPQLKALPIPPTEIFRLDLYFDEENAAAYYEENESALHEVVDILADQESKDTYEAVIRYRINRDAAYLKNIALPRKTQYFPEQLGGAPLLKEQEVFVDAGAFDGDTVRAFLKVNGLEGYQEIHAFEPDKDNFVKCMKYAEESKLENIFFYNMGVGDSKTQLRFASDDSSSKADQRGETIIDVDAMDHVLKDVPVTYLKMDVEGMECAALRGASKLIQTYKPKLAICTYHSDADMIEVPKLILEINPEYKLYFRHYTHAVVETVCYAI